MARRSRRARSPRAGGVRGTIRSLLILAFAALALRSLVVAPFGIPSESMLPQLQVGDYLLVAKWPYGWSRYSFPGSLPRFAGRILGASPARGDVVVFRNPADLRADYIKRVVGLPGDSVALRHGTLILNGRAVPQVRVADLLVPLSPNSPCRPGPGLAVVRERAEDGTFACRYPRYRELLPGGRTHDLIDLATAEPADEMAALRVPAGHFFVLGDNRDRSADSRLAAEEGGTGLVPAENLVGRASLVVFSTDGSAVWAKPWTWWRAARGTRIGGRL